MDGSYLTSLGKEENQNQKVLDLRPLLHPTCFPNILTMAVLDHNKEVFWEVHDNFQKQTYRNRYHICTDQGLHKLSIPIRHVGGKDGRQKYREVQIDNSYRWQLQHWRTLQTAYRTSPFFEFYEDDVAPLFHREFKYLMAFNWDSIRLLCDSISLNPETQHTEGYSKVSNEKHDYRPLVNAKKETILKFEPYQQVFAERHGFIPNTSALDLLFNEGPNASTYLKNIKIP